MICFCLIVCLSFPLSMHGVEPASADKSFIVFHINTVIIRIDMINTRLTLSCYIQLYIINTYLFSVIFKRKLSKTYNWLTSWVLDFRRFQPIFSYIVITDAPANITDLLNLILQVPNSTNLCCQYLQEYDH
jgi:hypothetical protein